jgi:hypothetical protein
VKRENAAAEKLLPLTEQMKAWSAALAAELRDWPQVTQKSFFGFTALYRGRLMFGLLPRTRSVFKGNAVAFRLEGGNRSAQMLLGKDSRIAAFDKAKARWFTFQILGDSDLHDALDFLGRAFDAAGNRRKSK